MKVIAHISDLHFGTEDTEIAEGLILDLKESKPDLLIVSGDLTQRGRNKQFIQAANFLKKIPSAKIIVPGNHDIPLFDVVRRFFFPLTRYKKYITADLNPFYIDEEIAVHGINTARSFTWENGRISVEQMKMIEKVFCSKNEKLFGIIVTHHPFIPPPKDAGIDLVGRSAKAFEIIDKCGVDLLLAGHIHHGYSGDISPFYPSGRRSIISVQAGTAVSNRTRREPNAYNLIHIEKNFFTIEIRIWERNRFSNSIETSYKKRDNEWIRHQD